MKVCPSCSTRNPSENNFCGQCGTRLPAAAETSATADILQAQPSTQLEAEAHRSEQHKSETGAPDWLRNLYTSPTRPSETTLVSSSSDDLPDWLRAMETPDVSQHNDEPTPAATQQREPQPADTSLQSADVGQTNTAPPIGQELPGWLLEEEPATPATAEQEFRGSDEGYQEDTALPPWLLDEDVPSSQAVQPTSALTTQELPAWLDDDTGESPAAPPDRPSADSALPPWLIDQQSGWPDEPVQTSIATEQQPPSWHLPSWLVDSLPATTDDPSSRPTTKLPAWLTEDLPQNDVEIQGIRATEAIPSLPPQVAEDDVASTDAIKQRETSPAITQEIPSWLLADAPETQVERSEPATAAVQASSTGAELPAWLLEDTTTPSQTDGGTTDDTLPPWLHEDLSPDQPAQPSSDAAAQSDVLPAWLIEDDAESGTVGLGRVMIYNTREQQPPRLAGPERTQPFDTLRQGPTYSSTLPGCLHEATTQPEQTTAARPSTVETAQGHSATMEMAVAPRATQPDLEPASEAERSLEPTDQLAAQPEASTEGGGRYTLIYLFVALLVVLALVLLWLAALALGLI